MKLLIKSTVNLILGALLLTFDSIINFLKFFSKDLEFIWLNQLSSILHRKTVVIESGPFDEFPKLKFNYGNYRTKYRATTAYSKEPHTIEWLKRFGQECEFYDVGANVGVFSLFFSSYFKSESFAFEASIVNSLEFWRNVKINNLGNLITLVPMPLGEKCALGKLLLPGFDSGQSFVSFKTTNTSDVSSGSSIVYSAIALTLDSLFQNSIIGSKKSLLKIDVDGNELEILRGSHLLLNSGNVKSIAVEKSYSEQIQFQVDMFLGSMGYRKFQVQIPGDVVSSNEFWVK
jgi:FkbM family methyltransferase